jgi:hypothetical protein
MSVSRKMQALLPVLALGLQFAIAPCAMAMSMESAGDCEHCDSLERPAWCMVAADQSAADADCNPHDRLRAGPPANGVSGLLPLPAVPQTLQRAESSADAIARRTGRHSGDPPLNLLYGSFLI